MLFILSHLGGVFILIVASLPSSLFLPYISAADSGDHLSVSRPRYCRPSLLFSHPSLLSLVKHNPLVCYFHVSRLRLTTTTTVPPPSARPRPLLGGPRYIHYDMLWTSWAPLVSLLLLVLTLGVAWSFLVDRRPVSLLHVLIGLVCVLVGFLPLDRLSPYNFWADTSLQAHLKDLDRFCEEHARMILFGAAVIWYASPLSKPLLLLKSLSPLTPPRPGWPAEQDRHYGSPSPNSSTSSASMCPMRPRSCSLALAQIRPP